MQIGFIGLGKLGLPVAELLQQKGYKVTGYDSLKKSSKHIDVVDNINEAIVDKEIVFVAVPTPHSKGYGGQMPIADLEPEDFDYTSVKQVINHCNQIMHDKQILVLISTVLPGTVRKHFKPICTNTNLIYNPYLIAMGTVQADVLAPEMIMIGTESGRANGNVDKLKDVYYTVSGYQPRTEIGTWEEVEAMKIFYNTFISTKLTLVNMIQDVADTLGNMNADKVANALANSHLRIMSSRYMKPGMGDGGSCHPRDNIALRWLAKELNLGYDIFHAVMTARDNQAKNMARAILKHGKNIYFTSDYYKPDVPLTDGSYSLLVQHYVKELGGKLVNGFDHPVEVVVRVHESDKVQADSKTIIFDPWRTYPMANNVVHYGDSTDK